MEHDPVRQKIAALLWRRGVNMREASLSIGRNAAYMHQFLERGIPKVLGLKETEKLAGLLGCDAEELRPETAPKRKPWTRRPRAEPPDGLLQASAAVPEMEVEAAAGPGALNDEFAAEKARWRLPEGMIRHEGDAIPEDLRILRVRGNSMEPEMREGDRLMVDTARRRPATGELFVLWDGNGLVAKRVETLRGEPPRLRLLSANPDYGPYTCLADEVHIAGKILWVVRRIH